MGEHSANVGTPMDRPARGRMGGWTRRRERGMGRVKAQGGRGEPISTPFVPPYPGLR